MRMIVVALAVLVASGCVYPRRHTSLTAVSRERMTGSLDAPPDIWQLTLVEAQIRPRKAGDLHWDDGTGLPDVYVRIYRDDVLLWESETVDDSLTPRWGVTLPRNVRVDPHRPFRIEVWDRDTVGADPVGIHMRNGLPENAVSDADARIMLEGGSYVTIRASPPRAHRGVGIAEFEVQPEGLVVLDVLPSSPAGRAGIVNGERIVAIAEQSVGELTDAQAASALSMAANRQSSLTVRDSRGRERQVELDRGYVWLTM